MEKLISFAQTSIGASHLSREQICQDSSFAADYEGYSFAAAADGHGSACYLRTDRGSRFAVECAAECVAEFLEVLDGAETALADERQREQLFNQLWRSIIARWHDKTEQDFISNPFTEEELDRIQSRRMPISRAWEVPRIASLSCRPMKLDPVMIEAPFWRPHPT